VGRLQQLIGGFLPLAGGTLTGALTTNGQVAFPATQNPSADPNTLDDYEEGTFTPVLAFSLATTGITYAASSQLGRYTKTGRVCTTDIFMLLTSKGTASGAAQFLGHPFTSANDTQYTVAPVWASAMVSVVGAVICGVKPNDTKLNIYHTNNGAGAGLSNSNFANNNQFLVSSSYVVA
jgi:hypothetical protein